MTDAEIKDVFDEICSSEYQAQIKEECTSSRYRSVLSMHDRFLSDGFWSDKSINGTSDHAQWWNYELWITPSSRDDRYALRICPNMINGVAHEWGFEFDLIEDVREAAWEFVVAREKHMVGFYRKYGFGPYKSDQRLV
jgi:hypothetical protein